MKSISFVGCLIAFARLKPSYVLSAVDNPVSSRDYAKDTGGCLHEEQFEFVFYKVGINYISPHALTCFSTSTPTHDGINHDNTYSKPSGCYTGCCFSSF